MTHQRIKQYSIMRLTISFLCFFTFCAAAQAQFSIGVNSSLMPVVWHTKTDFIGQGIERSSFTKLGFRYGAHAEYQLNQHWSVRAEAAFAPRNVPFEFTDDLGATSGLNVKFRMFDFSGLAKYYLKDTQKGLYLLAGTTLCFAGDSIIISSDDFETSQKEILPDGFNTTFITGDAGLGYSIKFLKNGRIFVESRYQFALNRFASFPAIKQRFSNGLLTVGMQYSL
jgi:hypothetical protein